MELNNRTVLKLAFLTLGVVTVLFGAVAALVFSQSPKPHRATTATMTAFADEMPRPARAESTYTPTSQWIQEGLDPETSELDLAAPDDTDPSVDVDGSIREFVHSRYNDLIPCYAEALQEEDLEGRVDLQFGITRDGEVVMVKVTHSELESPTTEDCLVDKAKSWNFPSTGKAMLTKFDSDFHFSYN